MSSVPLFFAAYKRTGLPEALTVNCFAEKAPTKPSEPVALMARAGLEDFEMVGTAPIRGVFQKQGLLDSAALIVASTAAYTLDASGATTTLTGTPITGDDLADIDGGLDADSETIVRIVATDLLYKVEAGAITAEDLSFAALPGATSIAYYKGYWLLAIGGILYYLIPASSSWSALQFAAADYAPDKLKGVRVFGELFALLGEATTEVWRATGEASSPLEPYGGLNFDYGCLNLHTAVNCQGALIWVDHNCSVRMCEGGDARLISDNGLTEQIRRTSADDIRASSYVLDQHVFYVLTLGSDATWVYDLSTQQWHRRNSNGYDFWRAHLFCNIGGSVFAADALSAQIWRLDSDRRLDGTETFTREFSAYAEVLEGSLGIANLELHVTVGDAPLSGQGSEPLIWMQPSFDGGRTFGAPKYRSLGQTGKYRTRVRWNGLGTAYAPFGVIFKFGVSDPVGLVVTGGAVNVP